jgi:LacI family transcriptional regulator
MSTRCNEQLTFDIAPYSAVAAKCARPLSVNGTQVIVAITENEPERQLMGGARAGGEPGPAPLISPRVHMLKRRAGCSWGCRSPR